MSDLRTAAQQALEACEQRLPLKGQAAIIDELNNLRAALAQEQDEPLNLSDPAVQKRLATQWGYVPAAQAEPVQEPVYKVKVTSRWHDTEPLAPAFSLPDGEHLLYIAPPQRKPLPKHDQHCVDVPGYGLTAVRLVRAVERAHGIT